MDLDRYLETLKLMAVYAGGIVAYGVLVSTFYVRLSKRDMFGLHPGAGQTMGRVLGYLSVFPLLSFLFFLTLSVAFLFLDTNDRGAMHAFLLAMSVVAAVRVTAYLREETAHDLAKLLPLGFLAVFLVTFEYQGLVESMSQLKALYQEWDIIALYFGVLVLMEFVLRGLRAVTRPRVPTDRRPAPAKMVAPAAQFQRR